MNSLKTAVIVLAILTLGLGGYIIYKEFIAEKETVNVTEYETKITNLENENKKLREDIDNIETACPEVTPNPYEEYAGTYLYEGAEYNDESNEKCSHSRDENTHMKIELKSDGTFTYEDFLKCGTANKGSGKYIVYNNVITAYNDDCIKETQGMQGLQDCPLKLTYKIENNALIHSLWDSSNSTQLTMTKK